MESTTSHRTLTRLQRREHAWELRLAGHTFKEIAKQLGTALSTIHHDVQESYAEYREKYSESASQAATIDLQRLDKLIASYWAGATSGDVKAAQLVVKLLEQRGKIHGYHAPVKIEAAVDTVPTDAELEEARKRGIL